MRAKTVNNKIIKVSPEYMEKVRQDKPEGTFGNSYEGFSKWIKHWDLSKEEVQERIDNGLDVTYDDYVGYSEMLSNKEYKDEEEKEMLEERVEGAKYMNTVWQMFQEYLNKYFRK